MWTLLLAVGLGVALAAPVRPVALLCASETCRRGIHAGRLVGIGAAFADALIVTQASWCLASVGPAASGLSDHAVALRLVGGALLVLSAVVRRSRSQSTSCATGFLATLVSPITALSCVALFASPSATTLVDRPAMLGCGVFLGAYSWWFGVSLVAARRPDMARPRRWVWLERIADAALALLGIVVLGSGLAALV